MAPLNVHSSTLANLAIWQRLRPLFFRGSVTLIVKNEFKIAGNMWWAGGGRAGFVNRLIGAIFASLVCHSTFSRCVTARPKSRVVDIGSPEGPVDQLAGGTAWATTGLWLVAANRIRAYGSICGGNPNGRPAAPGVLGCLIIIWSKTNKEERRGQRQIVLDLAGGCWTWRRTDVCEKDCSLLVIKKSRETIKSIYRVFDLTDKRSKCKTSPSTRHRQAQCRRVSWATSAWWAAPQWAWWEGSATCPSANFKFIVIWGVVWGSSKELVSVEMNVCL